MTKEELIEAGWEPRECLIDTLYFKGGYFCVFHRKQKDKVYLYSVHNDTNPLGLASTLDEIRELQKTYELEIIRGLEKQLEEMKLIYKVKYGEEIV